MDNKVVEVSNNQNDFKEVPVDETNVNIQDIKTEISESKEGKNIAIWIIGILLTLGIIALIIALCVVYAGRIKGDIIEVTTSSAVGFNIDDFPVETRERVINDIIKLDDSYWINRVNKQVSLTLYRLTFRSLYYDNARSLAIPPSDFHEINFTTKPKLGIFDGHQVVYRNYTMKTHIIGKLDSAEISDAKFKEIGGVVNEDYILPVDPTLILQNTEYACMDEDLFPVGSVDAESTEVYYDDQCIAGGVPDGVDYCSGDEYGCHCTKKSEYDCPEAVRKFIGAVELNLRFEKIKFDYELADNVEAKNKYFPNRKLKGADLYPVKEGMENNFSVYKYFSCSNSCEMKECLNNKCGWRKLIIFDTTDVNIGKEPIFVGNISYTYNPNEFNEQEYKNMFYYDSCHKHAHYAGYIQYAYNGTIGGKLGFCMQDTDRIINHRDISISSTFDTCKSQGISPGYGDTYNRGIPCQWLDVTEFSKDLNSLAFTQIANPETWLCEGKMKMKDGNPVFVDTGLKTDEKYRVQGNPIYKYDCETDPAVVHGNNRETINFKLTPHGHAMLIDNCKYKHFTIGPKRDCEFTTLKNIDFCTASIKKSLTCINSGTQPVVLRICEASRFLNSGIACRYNDDSLLKNTIISANSQISLDFNCPSARDAQGEIGGAYSIYIGELYNIGVPSLNDFNVSCS